MIDTLRTLLRIALHGPEDSFSTASEFGRVRGEDWARIVDELDAHRMAPLVAYSLRRHELEEVLPAPVRARLRESYRQTLWVNEVHAQVLRTLLAALRKEGIEPILFKGLVLGAGFYPDPGARPMVDIDLLIDGPELRRAVSALRSVGFERDGDDGGTDAGGFRNKAGAAVDLHLQFDLFPVATRQRLVEERTIRTLGDSPIRTWEPNAMVVHLVVHLFGHRPVTGLSLGWLFDLAFVVRALGDRLDEKSLRALSPSVESFALLGRVLAFLERECGLGLAPQLAAIAARHDGFSLARILREGRLRPWGLPSCVGWLRVIQSWLWSLPGDRRRRPNLADLGLGVFDSVAEGLATRRAIAATRSGP